MENKKQAIVTGGTSGVGLSIVKALVKANYFITVIGSNAIKGKKIETEFGQLIQFVQLDLSDLIAVKQFSKNFTNSNSTLNLLVNVAGIMSLKQHLTPSGLDKTFTIGYLSAFVLSNDLIPLLEKTPHARIVNVAGNPKHIMHVNLDFNNLNFTKNYNGFKTAIATIHAKTVLTQLLAEKLINQNIDVNCFHPGTVKSDLTRNMPILIRWLAKMASPFMAKSSTNGIYVCIDNSINNVSGKLFVNKKPTSLTFDYNYMTKIWNTTENLIIDTTKLT